jgi:nitrate/TMAO reductase-like tetraheme cytochrome c subunit
LRFTSILPRLWTNWITLLGSVVTTISGLAILVGLVIELLSSHGNPYVGLFVVIALPAAFGCGLLLIPLGLYVDRRRKGSAPRDALQSAFELAFRDKSARARIGFVAVATIANVGLFAYAGHAAVAKMDSPKFCGETCHGVMQPEWEAWNRSPHSHVACVECHIGPGATSYVKAKWNGLHQMKALLTSTYHRPVPSPADKLRPARETCEECHSPQRYDAERIKLYPHYELDKDNTPKFNALALRIGGLNPRTHKYEGAHAHANPDRQIDYEYLDEARSKIGKITVREKGQVAAEYLLDGAPHNALGTKTMDCLDCHNRPAHVFETTPKDAVDRALFAGALDAQVPFLAQTSIELLRQADVARDRAGDYFRAALATAYRDAHPDVKPEPAALDKAATALTEIYLRNIYPGMNLRWNSYHSNLGHKAEGIENPGCFRCHDKKHEATLASGRKKRLGQDCDLCHVGIAFDTNPAKFDDTLAAMMPGN